jgi:hypothetical protein
MKESVEGEWSKEAEILTRYIEYDHVFAAARHIHLNARRSRSLK